MNEEVRTVEPGNIIVTVEGGGVLHRYHFLPGSEIAIEKNGMLRVGTSLFPSDRVLSIIEPSNLASAPTQEAHSGRLPRSGIQAPERVSNPPMEGVTAQIA
jgi:hypothetical protein